MVKIPWKKWNEEKPSVGKMILAWDKDDIVSVHTLSEIEERKTTRIDGHYTIVKYKTASKLWDEIEDFSWIYIDEIERPME